MGECAPGKDCCDDCKSEPVKQEAPPLVVWGPISDEVPSRDNPPKLIRAEAVQEALPQILRRGIVDVNHKSEFVVAKVVPVAQVDLGRVPPAQQAMVREVQEAHGGLPTGMVRVTPAIAAVFPRVAHRVGEALPFAASVLYDDNRTSRRARQDILEGRLDSYSLAGASYGARYKEHCDPSGCQVVQEIPSLDGSSLTFTSYEHRASLAGVSRAANPSAGFVVVQQATRVERLKDAGEGSGSVDAPAAAPVTDAAPAPVAQVEDKKDGDASAPVVGLVAVPAAPEVEAAAVAQTTPPATTGAPAAEAVKQEDASAPKVDVEAVLAQVVKRLTEVETEVALLKGRKEEAPAPAAEKEADDSDEEEAPKEDEKDEADKESKPVKQAAPAAPVAALKQTVPEPAAPEAAHTPTPSAPGTPGPDPVLQALYRDMDNGDPSALKRLRSTYGGRKA